MPNLGGHTHAHTQHRTLAILAIKSLLNTRVVDMTIGQMDKR
jgi:hypothetical protein